MGIGSDGNMERRNDDARLHEVEEAILVYQAILGIINAFQYFQQVYIIVTANSGVKGGSAAGGPENSILMYPLYIFHNAFTYLKMGKASAMAWLLFIVVAILAVVMVKVTAKVTDSAGRE